MKSVSESIAYLSILLISIILISLALYWAIPWFQKTTDEQKIIKYFDECCNDRNSQSLVSILKESLYQQTEKQFYTSIEGTWDFYPDYITLRFISKVQYFYPENTWIFIDGCGKNVCEFGKEKFFDIHAMSRKVDSAYEIIFKITLKTIVSDGKTYEIKIINPKSNLKSKNFIFSTTIGDNAYEIKII